MRENGRIEQKLYTVTEAVQKSGVPSHVLRYWEDELGMTIRRSALGHRVYSEEDLALFHRVKELKEMGIQLKAIRLMLDGSADRADSLRPERLFGGADEERPERLSEQADKEQPEYLFGQADEEQPERLSGVADEVRPQQSSEKEKSSQPERLSGNLEYEMIPVAETDNYLRFESMLRSLISETVAEQNENLKQALSDLIRDEMDDLYIQLQKDESWREAAAARMGGRGYDGPGKRGLLERIRKMIKW